MQVPLQKQYKQALFHYSIFILFSLEQKVRGNFLKVLWFNANQAWLTGGRTSPLMSVGELKIMFTFPCLVSKQPLYHMWVLQEPACAQIHKHRHMLEQAASHRHTCIRFYYLLFVLHSWAALALFWCPTGDKGLVLCTERSQAHLLSVRDSVLHRKWFVETTTVTCWNVFVVFMTNSLHIHRWLIRAVCNLQRFDPRTLGNWSKRFVFTVTGRIVFM